VLQWLSVSLSTKVGGVFGTIKDLGSTKIRLQAIAAAVLFPESKESPEVPHSILSFVKILHRIKPMKLPQLNSDSATLSLIENHNIFLCISLVSTATIWK
jgi:hypothetical protein